MCLCFIPVPRSASLFLFPQARLVRTESVPCDINNPLRYADLNISQTLPKTNKINKVSSPNSPPITVDKEFVVKLFLLKGNFQIFSPTGPRASAFNILKILRKYFTVLFCY